MDPYNPKINSEADARAWFEVLITADHGTAHIPNPDYVREEMANGYFGAFADLTERGVAMIRQAPGDEDEGQALLVGVALIQDAARMNDAMARVWEVVADPHRLATEVEARRAVPDVTRPAVLDTFGDVRAWFRALISDWGLGELPLRTFAESYGVGEGVDVTAVELVGLDAALARVRGGFGDVDRVFAEVLERVTGESREEVPA